MQKIIVIVILVLLRINCYSQENSTLGSCANERFPFTAYPKATSIIYPKAKYAMAGVSYVPVKLHIIRNNSGVTSLNKADFLKSFVELNNTFKSIDVQFYILPNINYIDNTVFYDFNADFEEESLCSGNDVNNAVNLYLTNSILFSYGFNATGYAYYPSPLASSNRIFVANSAATSSGRTLTHEFGHYFNLLHTFSRNNSADITARELVTRGAGANCDTAGDLLCDTPADPYGIPGAVTSGCSYTGSVTDANGMAFSPQLSNIMSYYSEVCGREFSANQFERLSEGYIFRNSPSNQYTIEYTDPNVPKPTNLTASVSPAGVTLNYEDNAPNEFGFIIERAFSEAGPFEPLMATMANTESATDQDLLSNTTFYYRVRAANGIQYSNIAEATTGTFYCQPTYQQSCNDFQVVIEQFSIAGTSLSNINSGCSPDNYGKFTDMVANLESGSAYTFNASATTTANTPFFPQSLSIWVDYDQDGFFDNNEKVYASRTSEPSSGMGPAVSALINIPSDAQPGLTTLRVRSQFGQFGSVSDPCNELIMGETEDYVVNIVSPNLENSIEVTSIAPLSACLGNSITVGYEVEGGDFSGNTDFVVQIDNGSGQFIDLPTQSNGNLSLTATLPTFLATGSNFNIRISATNPNETSPVSDSKLTVNAVPSTPTLAINQPTTTVCVGSSVSVNATGCTSTVNWSNGATGNPITFIVNSPISLTASCTSNGCTGGTSATMFINTKPLPSPPTVQIVGSESIFCSDETVTLSTSGCAGVVNWSSGQTGNSISFTAISSTSITATCKLDGCESVPSSPVSITVNQKPSPPSITLSSGPEFCFGDDVLLNAVGCNGTVRWSNGLTGNSISFAAVSATSVTATCIENSCESIPSNLISITVGQSSSSPEVSLVSNKNTFCPGDLVSVFATACSNGGTVTWSNGVTGNTASFAATTSILLTARCQNACGESEPSNAIQITVNEKPSPPTVSVEGGSLNHCVGEIVRLNAANCNGTVNWNNGETGNNITVVVTENVSYSATCVVNSCESFRSNSIVFECIIVGSKIKEVALDLKVILEGPYNSSTELMSTNLNDQGLLPGQVPLSQFAIATPAGQPYNRSPWNYEGSENVTNYASSIVDWVLVSLKEDDQTIIYQTAALLHADSHIELVADFPELDTTLTYFIQIEHRNHLGGMSARKIAVNDLTITYDFTSEDSYIRANAPAFGQKLIEGSYAMFVGDIDKSSAPQHYDINFADMSQLRSKVGVFAQYLDADLTLDTDVNFNDLIIWRANSGKFSSITY